jgi:2-oxoglutarate/2-oxoacid ferredoxin oxidoreductase subunit alpha
MQVKIKSKTIADLGYIDYKEENMMYGFQQGNETCAQAAILAGCNFYGGYPITPSSEIAEVMSRRLPLEDGVFIQMEDEIASMGSIIGAAIGGAKSMTATSGPGFSLMQENIGYAVTAEIPCVVVNVQRVGPSTGLPTSPAQGDVMQAKWGTHGDHPIIVLSPSTIQEVVETTIAAFDFSERYRIPVILLMDEIIGHMRERVGFPIKSDIHIFERKQNLSLNGKYKPYRNDVEDGVPPMMNFGDGERYHITGLIHDEYGFPTRKDSEIQEWFKRLFKKIEIGKERIQRYEVYNIEDADTVIISYGISARTGLEAMYRARQQGKKVGMIKLITIWPFPEEMIQEVMHNAEKVIVPEMNRGQLIGEVQKLNRRGIDVIGVNRYDGHIISPRSVLEVIGG